MKNNPMNFLLAIALAESIIQQLEAENNELRERVAGHDRLRVAHDQLKEQVDTLGRQNIALAAWAENAEQLEQQLTTADERIRELETALAVAKLPAASRDNVIQMVREAA